MHYSRLSGLHNLIGWGYTLVSDGPVVSPTRPAALPQDRVRRLPPYHVIILNDDDHSFEFVIHVLRQVLKCTVERAFSLTKEAHEKGRAVVWTGSREVAELKAEQIQTFHEVRERDGKKLGPIGCVIEPAPG
jgi:ATP-dependent Clp protease adaptor protein ClpS